MIEAFLPTTCDCDFRALGRYTFKSPAHYRAIAKELAELDLSGSETWDFLVEELWYHHTGALIDVDGKSFRFRSEDIADRNAYDAHLREDQRRLVNRIKEKAKAGWAGQYRMQERMLYPMQVVYFGLRVHACRTAGNCASCRPTTFPKSA